MINKINVDGFEYNVGDNKAKLVASGTPVPTIEEELVFYEGKFQLDNKLENNKLYFIKLYLDTLSFFTSTIVFTYQYSGRVFSSRGEITISESFDDTLVSATVDVTETRVYIFPHRGYITYEDPNDERPQLTLSENDYVEVYELPFTLGGN